jgi:hypothetical protein
MPDWRRQHHLPSNQLDHHGRQNLRYGRVVGNSDHKVFQKQGEAAIEREAIAEAYHRKIDAHERATGEKYPRIAAACVTPNGNIYSDLGWKPRLIATWQKLLSGKYHIELV